MDDKEIEERLSNAEKQIFNLLENKRRVAKVIDVTAGILTAHDEEIAESRREFERRLSATVDSQALREIEVAESRREFERRFNLMIDAQSLHEIELREFKNSVVTRLARLESDFK
ncbi:MAG: hypothetical protein H7Z37_04120 [Pyrinomonadaceae bacterium]|nr:hypothetical protein [Pyrinomonadaceae bacterium]